MTTICRIPEPILDIFDPTQVSDSRDSFRFALEAELDGLLDTVERIEHRRPELFRETERCRDLLDRLHALLDAGQAD